MSPDDTPPRAKSLKLQDPPGMRVREPAPAVFVGTATARSDFLTPSRRLVPDRRPAHTLAPCPASLVRRRSWMQPTSRSENPLDHPGPRYFGNFPLHRRNSALESRKQLGSNPRISRLLLCDLGVCTVSSHAAGAQHAASRSEDLESRIPD